MIEDAEIASGTLAWVMTSQGVIHRAQRAVFPHRAYWVIACRETSVLADQRWRVIERRPRDANVCVLCMRKLGARRVADEQTALFDRDTIDGRK